MSVISDWKKQKDTYKAIYNILANMEPDKWYTYQQLTKHFNYGYVATQKMVTLLKEQKLIEERGNRRNGKEFMLNNLGLETRKMFLMIGKKVSPKKVKKAMGDYDANNSSTG